MARDAYPRVRDTLPVEALLRDLIDLHHLTPEVRAHRILIEWATLVGPQIARVTAPDGLRNGVLSVWVKTSTWMQELRLLRDRVIADINAGLGDPPTVTELRLHFGAARLVDGGDPLARLRRDRDRRRPPPRRVATPAPPGARGRDRARGRAGRRPRAGGAHPRRADPPRPLTRPCR
ncbi:MAG: DUF721 domain-containing protein [Myxococcales bacterium]|nr:DUF721 domain-containing protein [Myxococcales bacterium]